MKILEEIERLLKKYFEEEKYESSSKVPLMTPSYGHEEVIQVIDSLLKRNLTLNLSSDNKIGKFEDLWASYIGMKNGIMLNSGSSANLIALSVLSNPSVKNPIQKGDEIITPAVTWSTTVAPMFCIGAVPRFVDVNLSDFSIDADQIESAINEKTKAIMIVHVLGFPCNMDKIVKIAKKRSLYLIEDCCESHGAEFNGKKVGSFGDFSTFSFFWSHHLTSIEGGMALTNNDDYAELARIMRSQGVMRNVKDKSRQTALAEQYPDIDPKYLFANLGYNLRPSELQGGFGLVQFNKFPSFLTARKKTEEFLNKNLNKYSDYLMPHYPQENGKSSWFAYPIAVKENDKFTASQLKNFLVSKGIECRPIISGNYTKHPVAKLFKYQVHGNLKNADYIHKNGFYFGNHPGIGKEQQEYIVKCFDEFFSKLVR